MEGFQGDPLADSLHTMGPGWIHTTSTSPGPIAMHELYSLHNSPDNTSVGHSGSWHYRLPTTFSTPHIPVRKLQDSRSMAEIFPFDAFDKEGYSRSASAILEIDRIGTGVLPTLPPKPTMPLVPAPRHLTAVSAALV